MAKRSSVKSKSSAGATASSAAVPPKPVTIPVVSGVVKIPKRGELTPTKPAWLQWAGYQLAGAVLAAIVGLAVFAMFDFWHFSPEPPTLNPPEASWWAPKESREHTLAVRKQVMEEYTSAHEVARLRLREATDMLIMKVLLPVLTALLGYLFGTRTLSGKKDDSADDDA